MKRWLWIAGALMVTGCASNGYRYEDDGYWTAPRRASSVVVSVGWGGCGGWGGGYGHPFYGSGYGPRFGYPYGYGWSSCGFGYGYGGWYGAGLGYWRDPYWSHPWYLPGQGNRAFAAGERARQMARYPAEDLGANPGYDDLMSSRRRDLGGGDRSWRSGGESYAPILLPSPQRGIGDGMRGSTSPGYPTPPQGLGTGRLNSSEGLSGPSRSSIDQRANPSPRSGGFSAPEPRSAPSSLPRERRDEE